MVRVSHFQVLALWKHQVKFGKVSRHLRTFRFGVFQYLTRLLNMTGTLEWDKSIPAWGICNGWFFSPMSLANQPILNRIWIIALGLLCPLQTHAAAWRISLQDFFISLLSFRSISPGNHPHYQPHHSACSQRFQVTWWLTQTLWVSVHCPPFKIHCYYTHHLNLEKLNEVKCLKWTSSY